MPMGLLFSGVIIPVLPLCAFCRPSFYHQQADCPGRYQGLYTHRGRGSVENKIWLPYMSSDTASFVHFPSSVGSKWS
ncbi:hypothetical protein BS17DRAFT_777184 [Gyrodon lividus]|nr:hypothetical protein BS17DRAFT_777184 [Gyrodon lividus]